MQSYEIPKPPARPSRQDAEIKSKINLVLDGVAPDKKVEILSDLAEAWQNDSDRETFIKMGPVWRDLINQQDLYIKDLEKLKRRWAALAIFEFLLLLIWRFWEW